MTQISESTYLELAKELFCAIGGNSFYNSWIECEDVNHNYHCRVTIMVYRDSNNKINNIIPIWWELQSKNKETNEKTLTDFSWSSFIDIFMGYVNLKNLEK